MKLKWLCCFLIFALLLGGCHVPFSRVPQFTEAEETALVERGRELMEAQLPPGASITEIYRQAQNNATAILGHEVAGYYVTEDGLKWWFLVDTATGQVQTGLEEEPDNPGVPIIITETKDIATEEMHQAGLTVTLDCLSCRTRGYSSLDAVLQQKTSGLEQELLKNAEACLSQQDGAGADLRCEAHILRADAQVVSVYVAMSTDLGGAHPMVHARSYNFDAKTGNALKLEKLPGLGEDGAISDAFINAVSWELSRSESACLLDKGRDFCQGGYQETVRDCFWNTEKYPAWFLLEDGIQVLFDPYVLAPFSAGQIEVTVDYNYESGDLSDKYYPGYDGLLAAMEGQWRIYGGEVEGGVWYAAPIREQDTLTITTDGIVSLQVGFYDDGEFCLEDPEEFPLCQEDGGLWTGFPALQHLEYSHPEHETAQYSLALDGNRLILWVVDPVEQYASVRCYYRVDDPDRLRPQCLDGRWIAIEQHIPGLDVDYFCPPEVFEREGDKYFELVFSRENWNDEVPALTWHTESYIGEWEEFTVTPELVWGWLDEDAGTDWFLSFERDLGYDDGNSTACNIVMVDENLLVLVEHYYTSPDALAMVVTYKFFRDGTSVG